MSEPELFLRVPVESVLALEDERDASNFVVGHPHANRCCRGWLVADAPASLTSTVLSGLDDATSGQRSLLLVKWLASNDALSWLAEPFDRSPLV